MALDGDSCKLSDFNLTCPLAHSPLQRPSGRTYLFLPSTLNYNVVKKLASDLLVDQAPQSMPTTRLYTSSPSSSSSS
jgi:hypothetical protein